MTEICEIKCQKWTQALENRDWLIETEAACKFGNLKALKLFHKILPENVEK